LLRVSFRESTEFFWTVKLAPRRCILLIVMSLPKVPYLLLINRSQSYVVNHGARNG
jgi:hypothetical protein